MQQLCVQVCIAAFTKHGVVIKAHCWDQNAGGRNMDALLVDHFAREIKHKTGMNIMHNAKARVKLLRKVSRCRELLAASKKSYISIDSLTADYDFRCSVSLPLTALLFACLSVVVSARHGCECTRWIEVFDCDPAELSVASQRRTHIACVDFHISANLAGNF